MLLGLDQINVRRVLIKSWTPLVHWEKSTVRNLSKAHPQVLSVRKNLPFYHFKLTADDTSGNIAGLHYTEQPEQDSAHATM
jgi:hypothetical protein